MELAETIVETDGKNAKWLNTLAAAYARIGEFEKAVETQSKAVGLADPLSESYGRRLEQYKRRLAYPAPAVDDLAQAYQQYREKNFGKAAELFEQVYNEKRPGSAGPAADGIGTLYEQERYGLGKNLDTAIEWYLKAVGVGDYLSYGKLIDLHISPANPTHRDIDQALRYAEKLQAAMPENYFALRYVAKAYAQAGDFATAVAVQQKAVGIGKQGGVESSKSIADAEQVLEKYLRKEKPHIRQNSAFIQEAQKYRDGKEVGKDYRKAVELYTKAYDADERKGTAACGIGNLFAQGGHGIEKNLDAAVEWYEKSVDAGQYGTNCRLIMLYLSRSNPSHRDIDKALGCAKRMYEANPDSAPNCRWAVKVYHSWAVLSVPP